MYINVPLTPRLIEELLNATNDKQGHFVAVARRILELSIQAAKED